MRQAWTELYVFFSRKQLLRNATARCTFETYYIPEPLSALGQERLLAASTVFVSELVQTEMVSALSLRLHIGDLSLAAVQQATTLFASHLAQGLYVPLHLSSAVYRQAQAYITRYDLAIKAPDALHLAAVALAQAQLVTADRQLAHNAQALGIAVELLEGEYVEFAPCRGTRSKASCDNTTEQCEDRPNDSQRRSEFAAFLPWHEGRPEARGRDRARL